MPPHHSHDGPEHDDSKPGPRDDPRPENRHEHADRPGGAGADAERKRAEYLFDTWDGGDISRPDGLVRVAAGVDHEDLHRELLVKFRAEQVDAYELSSPSPSRRSY